MSQPLAIYWWQDNSCSGSPQEPKLQRREPFCSTKEAAQEAGSKALVLFSFSVLLISSPCRYICRDVWQSWVTGHRSKTGLESPKEVWRGRKSGEWPLRAAYEPLGSPLRCTCVHLIINSMHSCWELNNNIDSSPNATLAAEYRAHKLDQIVLQMFWNLSDSWHGAH